MTGATAVATIVDGVVTAITITSGVGYTCAPSVQLFGVTGTTGVTGAVGCIGPAGIRDYVKRQRTKRSMLEILLYLNNAL